MSSFRAVFLLYAAFFLFPQREENGQHPHPCPCNGPQLPRSGRMPFTKLGRVRRIWLIVPLAGKFSEHENHFFFSINDKKRDKGDIFRQISR